MRADRVDHTPAIRAALSDPTAVLDALGILGEGRARMRQAGGWIIRCPVHNERTPSCSVQNRDGALVWKCHGCQASGDAISLVAAVRGTSLRGRGFRDTLSECARLAGLWSIVGELEGRAVASVDRPRPAPATQVATPPRDYPPLADVVALWGACGAASDDPEVSGHLAGRAIDPGTVDARDLARALLDGTSLPAWARCRGGNWRDAGYRLIVPMFLPDGTLRSVRGWRVGGADSLPKRIPPSGHKASGMVMADEMGRAMLAGHRAPSTIVIVEGEPDFLSRCMVTGDPDVAVLGIVSGSWSQAMADRLPVGARVVIRTDTDQAGDRYAAEIAATLMRRCFVYRGGGSE